MEPVDTDADLVKCTYNGCVGYPWGGIVDSTMRPFHRQCATKALAQYGENQHAFLQGSIFGFIVTMLGSLFAWVFL